MAELTDPPWDVLAAELRACRAEQQQTWGDLDSALIGRYLAGEVSAEERRQVESAFAEHPELRRMTDLVRDVLNDFDAASPFPEKTNPNPESAADRPGPRLLAFGPRKGSVPGRWRVRQHGALAAAACLLLALGVVLVRRPAPVEDAARQEQLVFAHDSRKAKRDKRVETHMPFAAMPAPPTFAHWGAPRNHPEVLALQSELGRIRRTPPSRPVSRESISRVAQHVEKLLESPYAVHTGAALVAKEPSRSVKPPSDVVAMKMANDGPAAAPVHALREAVPYLVSGLQRDQEPKLQEQCGNVLARLGVVAPTAVPHLADALKQARSPRQQQIVVNVLKQLGPAAREAVPALQTVATDGPAEVRRDAEEALRCVCVPKWVGIRDQAGLFAVEARRRVDKQLRELSARHNVAFVAETVRSLRPPVKAKFVAATPAERAKVLAEAAGPRVREAGAERGVYFLICSDPPVVHVNLGDDARAKLAPRAEPYTLSFSEAAFAGKDEAKNLEEAVRLVEEALAPKK